MCVALGFACFSPIFESHDNLVMKTQPWVLKDLGSICHQVLVRLQASYFILLFSVPQTLTNTTLLPHLTPPFLALSLYLIFLFETLDLACNFSSACSRARGAQISLDYSKHYQSRDNKNSLVMMFKYMLKTLNNHHIWQCQKKFASGLQEKILPSVGV